MLFFQRAISFGAEKISLPTGGSSILVIYQKIDIKKQKTKFSDYQRANTIIVQDFILPRCQKTSIDHVTIKNVNCLADILTKSAFFHKFVAIFIEKTQIIRIS